MPAAVETDSRSRDVVPALIECFAIIFLGYLCGKLKFITSSQVNGLKVFVTYFALPAMAFKSLATLKLADVNWKFLVCILLAKCIIFTATVILTLALSRASYANAGLYAIASSQSNDFALGYPLISDLYSGTYPNFPHYLYLVAPIQLVLLNPIGLALMEYGQQHRHHLSALRVVHKLLWNLVKNPIIFMPMLAITWNLLTNASPISIYCLKLLDSLSAAFPAGALFLLGLSMVGQLNSMTKYDALTPVLIVTAKLVVCPLLLRHLVQVMQVGTTERESQDFGSLGFLYGMLPTAPSVFLFATQYRLDTAAVSTSMVVGTLFSGPFLLVSATVAPLSNMEEINSALHTTVICTGTLSAVCSLWVLLVLRSKVPQVSHGTTLCLILSQFILGVGGAMLWFTSAQGDAAINTVQSVLTLSGTFASRVWTALLSTLLAVLYWRSLCFVLRIRWLVVLGGFSVCAIITAAIAFGKSQTHSRTVDPNFEYGHIQANIAASILSITLVVTVAGMVAQRRFHMRSRGYVVVPSSSGEDEQQHHNGCKRNCSIQSVGDVEDLGSRQPINTCIYDTVCGHGFECSKEQTSQCTVAVQQYMRDMSSEDQWWRQVVLLLLLSISMVVGLAVSLWKPLRDTPTGILVELQFLDILLNYGQGILAFLVFGLDTCISLLGMLVAKLKRQDRAEQTCEQFLRDHYRQCVSEMVASGEEEYFRGCDLANWLVRVGLCEDRVQAEHYGRQLLQGSVITCTSAGTSTQFEDGIYTFHRCPLRWETKVPNGGRATVNEAIDPHT